MTANTADRAERTRQPRIGRAAVTGTELALAALVSYGLTTRILTSAVSSRDDQLLGGMWSVVATLFVYRESKELTIRAALSRTVATSLSFVLCLGYLLIFPFTPWGMAALIGMGAFILLMIDRSEDIVTNVITTAVVMVVAAISPQHAWTQPILRLVDTLIGVAVGIAAVLIGMRRSNRYPLGKSAPHPQKISVETTKETL